MLHVWLTAQVTCCIFAGLIAHRKWGFSLIMRCRTSWKESVGAGRVVLQNSRRKNDVKQHPPC